MAERESALESVEMTPSVKIVVTGNMGYVGPLVVRRLRRAFPDAVIEGVDSGFFAHCLTNATQLPELLLDAQHFCDVRGAPERLFEGADAVVQLAAISNDPMGRKFERATGEVNFKSSIRIAEIARKLGVKNYVFASSCSVYGAASSAPRREEDELNPLTAYAHSKVDTEEALCEGNFDPMVVTCLRFATACGMSERLRLDLVLNDFVAGALTSRKITVLSDGTPWRPLINVKDMARAIEWAITRAADNGGRFLAVNTGSDDWNYQVKELALAVAAAVPGTEVEINENAPPDKRSYRVDFSLFKSLAPNHLPQETLQTTIDGLYNGLSAMNFNDADFRNSSCIRLKVLEGHMNAGRLSEDLRWTSAGKEPVHYLSSESS
jgi:nucleoside-diphosphate-sugar epimerase